MKASELYLENRAEGTDNTLTTDEAKRYGDYRALEEQLETLKLVSVNRLSTYPSMKNIEHFILEMMAEDKITEK